MDQIQISLERKLITYSDFWKASSSLLEQGKSLEKGSYFQFLGSLIFSSFCFEAFLNHIGEHLFDCWPEIERKMSSRAKLILLAEKIGLPINFGELPWQILPKLSGFRDKVAHGKNEMLRLEQVVPADRYEQALYEILFSDWQKFATEENATTVRKHLEEILTIIHTAAKIEGDRLFDRGSQYRSASLAKK